MSEHDHNKRTALRGIGDDSLEAATIDRIAERIAIEGPPVVRRARRVYVATRAGGALVVLAVAALLFVRTHGMQQTETSPQLAAAKPCESWSAPAMNGGEQRTVLIGEQATVELDAGASFRAVQLEPCLIALALDEGRAVVHAHDLGGGTLEVRTPGGAVRVIGTLFAVEYRANVFKVEVQQGTVEVEPTHADKRTLKAGDRLRLGDDLATKSELEPVPDPVPDPDPAPDPAPDRGEKKPRAKHEEPSAPETADDLVAKAAQLRKAGDLDGARHLYQRAGALTGATAEAAWITLARIELSTSRPNDALKALDAHDQHFAGGDLAVESAWLRVQALDALGDRTQAEVKARALIERWPTSPQATTAKRWLERAP